MLLADTISPSDIAAIAHARDGWLRALNADDLEGLNAAGTIDIVALPPNEPALVGMDANREWHRSRIDQFSTHLTMSSDDIQGAGIWAIERLSFSIELTPRAGGAPLRDRGNCLWAWQRQTDGGWKIARAIWNSDTPLAAPDSTVDRRAIQQVADRYTAACNSGDVRALMAVCSDDIVVMPPDGAAIAGAGAVGAWFQAQFFDPFRVLLTFSFTELEVRGDRAVAYGPFQLTLTPRAGGAPIHDAGKYIDVYHRQADGSWKFARVIFNRDQPPPANA